MKAVFSFFVNAVKNFLKNNCSMHAAGLTYFALLAIVPVLCCVLVAAKACRVDELARSQINAQIDQMIERIEDGQNDSMLSHLPGFSTEEQQKKRIAAEEFAKQARGISDALFSRIEQFDVGTLGWVGFGFLLWTVISSLASVEDSFNQIFGVEKSRPIWKRAYMYLGIMIALPVMATVAMSMPILSAAKNLIVATLGATWLTKWVGDGLIWFIDWSFFRFAVTFALSSGFFAFFYWAIPNCRVAWRHAAIGGMLTALLFGGWLKLCAVCQVGIAKSSALYGSFAFLPIVLAWLYMSWQIVLFGACLVKESEKFSSHSGSS